MKKNFSIFAAKILSKEIKSKCSEANIILRFRRNFAAYRTEEVFFERVGVYLFGFFFILMLFVLYE